MGGVTHSGSGAVVAVAGLMPRDRSKCESFVICCSESPSRPAAPDMSGLGMEKEKERKNKELLSISVLPSN